MRLDRHKRRAAAVLAGAVVVPTLGVGIVAPAHGGGREARRRAAAPTDARIARRTIIRYFRLLDEGRGAEFCGEAVSEAVVESEGGLYRCAARTSSYVRGLERRSFGATLESLHILFMMVSDGISLHCLRPTRCPSSEYARWARQGSPRGVEWLTADDPSLASTTGARVVAVVDPRRSSPSRITFYYQAWDGSVLRASWSTATGSWNGSVVDTHTGAPFISDVRLVDASRSGPRAIVAQVAIRVGTGAPQLEEFRLVQEGQWWRADGWRRLAPPAV